MSRYDWMADALCANTDPELFHSKGTKGQNQAKKICNRCPVRRQCEDFSQQVEGNVAHPHRHGIWAAETPRTRADKTAGQRTSHRMYDDDVRRYTALGWTEQQIAQALGCTPRTVARARARIQNEQQGSYGAAA